MIQDPSPVGRTASDIELVRRLASGDLDGLGQLFDRYGDELRRFVLRMGVARSDADDLVQNTFLGALRTASRFNVEYTVRAWLFGIAAMMVRRHRRAAARLTARLLGWAHQPPTTEGVSPDSAAEQLQEAAQLRRALENLAPKKREAFVMVVLEGVPGEQAARALGIPVNTLWTRLHHARRELRQVLHHDIAHEATS